MHRYKRLTWQIQEPCLEEDAWEPTPTQWGGALALFSCRKMEVKANASISNAWTVQLASVTWFIFSSCEQAVSLQRDTDRGRRGRMESVMGEGGRHGIKWEKSNHSPIWMIWNSSVFVPSEPHNRVNGLKEGSPPSADSILDRKWKCSEFFIRLLKYLQSIFCCYCAGFEHSGPGFVHISQARVRILFLPALTNNWPKGSV